MPTVPPAHLKAGDGDMLLQWAFHHGVNSKLKRALAH